MLNATYFSPEEELQTSENFVAPAPYSHSHSMPHSRSQHAISTSALNTGINTGETPMVEVPGSTGTKSTNIYTILGPDLDLPLPVPAPRHLTLERQLNKSILISWSPPEAYYGQIEMYHVYVDGFLRTTVKATDKTKALVEGVDGARVKSGPGINGQS